MGVSRSVACLLVLASACSSVDDFESSPADVAGTYTVAVTSQEDSCGFPNWEAGTKVNDIKLTFAQETSSITGTIDGVIGTLIELWLGSKSFEGTVNGDRVQATNHGSRPFTQDNCTYTISVLLEGTLNGDALQGNLTYTPKTNGSPDCGALETCQAIQTFAGARPPK
jgi:hypothetical protein